MQRSMRFSGTVIVPADRSFVLERAKDNALARFEGYTATPAEGGWLNAVGQRVIQPVVQVTVWSDEEWAVVRWLEDVAYELNMDGEEEVFMTFTDPTGTRARIVS